MKKIFFLIFATTVLTSSAQLSMNGNGQVSIGNLIPDSTFSSEADTKSMLRVYGPYETANSPGAVITFGDNYRWAKNVAIGELGDTDSDKLWLHGKHALYYTHASNNDTVFYYDDQRGNFMQFNCDVKTTGVFVASDENFKRDIKPLTNAGAMLNRLTPVQYTLDPLAFTNKGVKPAESGDYPKADEDSRYYSDFYNNLGKGQHRFGLLAQEVESVFPELVMTDSNGNKYVDYIGMIPLLIDAINTMGAELECLKSGEAVEADKMDAAAVDKASVKGAPYLGQNAPSPFNAVTNISYRLPADASDAQLCVFDLGGSMLKSYQLPTFEKEGSYTISASEFRPGMYLYALLCDGKEIDVKRMILTE